MMRDENFGISSANPLKTEGEALSSPGDSAGTVRENEAGNIGGFERHKVEETSAPGPSHSLTADVPGTDRDGRGRFQPGNQAAVRHGAYRAALRGGGLPAELVDDMTAFRESVVLSLGGESELSPVALGYVRRLVELETFTRLFVADLEAHGIFTKGNRVRAAFSQLLITIDRWDKVATKLGLERRQRRLPDPAEWLEGKA